MGDLGGAAPPLVVGLPESLGRRMRLGPFPSARHALKFAAYAAIGGTVAAVVGAIWSVPFLGVGFLLSVYPADGRGLDDQLGEYVHFRWRARSTEPDRAGRPTGAGADPPYVTTVPGHLVAILAVGGLPIAFLPPNDARALFDAYREFLRSLDHGLIVCMALEPLTERPYLPRDPGEDTGGAEERARAGYAEMVTLLCRQRYRRRVLLAAWQPVGPDAAVRLEREVDRLAEQLGRLGLDPRRLRGAGLHRAVLQIGWKRPGAA